MHIYININQINDNAESDMFRVEFGEAGIIMASSYSYRQS